MQVSLQAVASRDFGDSLVMGVHDDVFALAETEREHLAVPESQLALAFVALDVQVLGGFSSRKMVEPNKSALGGVDQWPVLARPGPVGREDLARGWIAIGHGDAQDRDLDAGQRVEALVVSRRGLWIGEGWCACRRVGGVHAKVEGDPLAVRARPGLVVRGAQ